MAKNSITIFKNGASARFKNRRLSFVENENKDLYIHFVFADENPNTPACTHVCIKNKLRVTTIGLSEEAFEALIRTYYEYKKSKKYESS